MNTQNLLDLKICKLTKTQYDQLGNNIDPEALYLTPDDTEEKLNKLNMEKADNYSDTIFETLWSIPADDCTNYTVSAIIMDENTSYATVAATMSGTIDVIIFENDSVISWTYHGAGVYELLYKTYKYNSTGTCLGTTTYSEDGNYVWRPYYTSTAFSLPTPLKIKAINETCYPGLKKIIKSYNVAYTAKIDPEFNYKNKSDKYIIREQGTKVHPIYSIGNNSVVGKYSLNDIEVGTDVSGWVVSCGVLDLDDKYTEYPYAKFPEPVSEDSNILSLLEINGQPIIYSNYLDAGGATNFVIDGNIRWGQGAWRINKEGTLFSYTFPEGSIVTAINDSVVFNDNIIFVDHLYKTIDCKVNYNENKNTKCVAEHLEYSEVETTKVASTSEASTERYNFETQSLISPSTPYTVDGIINHAYVECYATAMAGRYDYCENQLVSFVLSPNEIASGLCRVTVSFTFDSLGNGPMAGKTINVPLVLGFGCQQNSDASSYLVFSNLYIDDPTYSNTSEYSFSFSNFSVEINYTVPKTITYYIDQLKTTYNITLEQLVEKLLDKNIITLADFVKVNTELSKENISTVKHIVK